tara:strand:+ start:268 stop:705 length:438 start_codon:yes stop_codon:yes gene_type:complete
MPIIEFSNLNKYGTMRTRRFYHPTTNYGLNPEGFGPSVVVKLHKYEHKHVLSPCITKLSGKTYIMPGWQEVVEGTTLNDVIHIKPKLKKRTKPIVRKALSSKGDITYKTKYHPDSGNFSCSCPGVWMSNNNCKHIKKLRLEINGK